MPSNGSSSRFAAPLDALVIGGGFYGCAIAEHLATQKKFGKVALVESEDGLLTRASYRNQARAHNGYHYPRSFTTAYRSRVNLPRFARDWPEAMRRDLSKIYAIARRNSKVTARQFRKFCKDIGARIEGADPAHRHLFNDRLIEDVFLVEEYVFDATRLAERAQADLRRAEVDIRLGTRAVSVDVNPDRLLSVRLAPREGQTYDIVSRFVFNCTYSGLNQFTGTFRGTRTKLKQEIAELALVTLPSRLANLGITVMDGPFFSLMPFPAQDLHTLSHVRFTPHSSWADQIGLDPYDRLSRYAKDSRYDRMVRDAQRFMPAISEARYVSSLFEVKTLLAKNEADDGRPILFEGSDALPGWYSVLGGKIDNIYDIVERIDAEIPKLG